MADPYEEALKALDAREQTSGPSDYGSALMSLERRTPNPVMEAATATAQGVNRGLSNVAGIPFDMSTWLYEQAIGREAEGPTLGSDLFGEGLEKIGASYGDIKDVPEEYRPFARGGEIFGESVPFAAAPFMAAARVPAAAEATGMLAPIVNAAKQAPGRFAAAEGTAAASSAAAGGGAYALAPENELVQAGAEVLGGTVNPTSILLRQMGKIPTAVNRIKAITSASGREASAARSLQKGVQGSGEALQKGIQGMPSEDPGDIARTLDQPSPIPGLEYPTAVKSGSPALLALQNRMVKEMPEFSNAIKAQMEEATDTLNRAYRQAVESGDPQAIRTASKERQDWFKAMMDTRIANASQARDLSVGDVGPTQARADASLSARDKLVKSLKTARETEKALWAEVPKGVEITPEGTRTAYGTTRGELLPEEVFPKPKGFDLEAFLKRARSENLTSGELQKARSRTLQEADRLRSEGEFNSARMLDNIADGMLDDIAGLSEEARSFSRALNESYRTPNVDRILARSRGGDVRVPPEKTLDVAMGGGGVGGNVAGRQLEEATQFGSTSGGGPGLTTLPEQNQFLLNMARNTVNDDGAVNVGKLSNFVRNNQEAIDRLGLGPQLGRAEDAQRLVDNVTAQAGSVRPSVEKSAFSKLVGFEDPVAGVKSILGGKTPLKDYRQLATTARQSGPQAVAGLRGATFEMLFDAMTEKGLISGKGMREIMTKKAGSGENLVDTMRKSGVLTEKQRENLFRVITEVERVEKLLSSGRQIDDILEKATGLEDLITRVIGANVGGMGTVGQISGAPIVAAQAGSKYAREFAQGMPMAKTKEVFAQALADPEFMAKLLRRTETPAQKAALQRQINAYLLQTAVPDQDDSETYVGP